MSKEGLCLMVKTVDNRHFFTELGNFQNLIEFSKGQNAEVSVVKPQQEVQVMALPDLARSLCDPNYNVLDPKYELVETRIGGVICARTSRQKVLAQAHEIRDNIEKTLLAGETISIAGLQEKFKNAGLTDASLRKHLMFVRLKLVEEGHELVKVGVGSYQLLKK